MSEDERMNSAGLNQAQSQNLKTQQEIKRLIRIRVLRSESHSSGSVRKTVPRRDNRRPQWFKTEKYRPVEATMFKKPVEARSQQRLSGADRKKLKRTIKERFLNASDADIDVLFPPKTEIILGKLMNRAHVYGVEGGTPMFFDVDGRGTQIFPTVYALWQLPELLPAFMLKGSEVSHYIIGGADLMFPGIRIPEEGFPSFTAGEIWAIKVPGNMAPIAVGVTAMSSSEALKAGLRGKALFINHYYHDSLWASADSPYVPNEGFYIDVVVEDPALSSPSKTVEGLDEPPRDLANIITEPGVGGSTHSELGKEISDELTSSMTDLKIEGSGLVEQTNNQNQNLSLEEVDALLERCLLQALHTTVKDKDLPLAGSMLWSSHLLPCRPPGVTLDIKKSSHKKLSKWLMSKSSSGLITAKEDKHKKEIIIQSVNRVHPNYTSFRPEKRQADVRQQSSDVPASEGSTKKSQIDVMEIFKSSTHVNSIFTSVGADTGQFYTASEVTNIVFRYVEMENLVKPSNPAIVILNPVLCDALYKGAVKKGSAYPSEIHKKDLGATFLKRMQVHHSVTRKGESTICKGAIRNVQILTERRQGNKKVTKVSGFETFLINPEALASELQKKFACSTTVTELPGKKGHEVLIQGGVIEDLAKQLVGHYGIPKRYIEVLDKTRR